MSSEALTWAKKISGVGIAAKSVLLALADYADHEGACFPSMRTLSRVTDMSERHVRRIIARLEDQGLVVRDVRCRKDQGQTSNQYRLQLEDADQVAPENGTATPRTPESAPPDTGVRPPSAKEVRPPRTPESAPPGQLCPPLRTPLEPFSSDEENARATAERPAEGLGEADTPQGLARDGAAADFEAFKARLRDDPRFGPGWVASWLDPCAFEPETNEVHPRSIFAKSRIASELGPELRKAQLRMGEPWPVTR